MCDDPHPLYIACQGAVTDLAYALLIEPGRKIRVFKHINPRLILNDMFAKLRINFGCQQ